MTTTKMATNIPGWGADARPADRPAFPRLSEPRPAVGVHWKQPDQQRVTTEIFHSIERPGVTAVFGTACPPRGISGMIRRRAYKYSESRMRHWLMLLAADRVDVVEGLLGDLGRGRIPNLFKEMGLAAEYKRKTLRLVGGSMLLGAGALMVGWMVRRRA